MKKLNQGSVHAVSSRLEAADEVVVLPGTDH